jgi:hypothetical protein
MREKVGMTEVARFMAEQKTLVAACKLLVAAANAHEAQEELRAGGLLDGETGALATLQSGELVSVARAALYRLLVSDGWQPPEQVRRGLSLDRVLADEQTGALGG